MNPELTFSIFRSQTESTDYICKMVFQQHDKEQEIELFDYDYDRRGHWYSIPRGTINARQHVAGILNGADKKSFIYSFAKAFAENNEVHPNDHIIANFTGYGDCTGWSFVIDLSYFIKRKEVKVNSIIDDYDLLMKKFNELQI